MVVTHSCRAHVPCANIQFRVTSAIANWVIAVALYGGENVAKHFIVEPGTTCLWLITMLGYARLRQADARIS
jgi:hypothetical protein